VVEFCKRVIEVRIALVLAFRIVLSISPAGRRISQLRRGMIPNYNSYRSSAFSISLLDGSLDTPSRTLAAL